MIRFLFWNICGVSSSTERPKGATARPLVPSNPRYTRLQRALRIIAGRDQIDIIILAESPFEGQLKVDGFSEAKTTIKANQSTKTRLEVYHRDTVRFPGSVVVERAILHKMEIVSSGRTLQLVSAHLYSSLHLSPKERERKLKDFAADIRDREATVGHRATIVMGDLNYDPYDFPVIDADGLNSVASKTVARQGARRSNRYEYPYFYNPMWAHLSDVTVTPPGTFYRRTKEIDCRFWYLPDQVLLRADLLDFWDDADLRIVYHAGKIKLLDKQGHPARKRFSDHLPVVCALDL